MTLTPDEAAALIAECRAWREHRTLFDAAHGQDVSYTDAVRLLDACREHGLAVARVDALGILTREEGAKKE